MKQVNNNKAVKEKQAGTVILKEREIPVIPEQDRNKDIKKYYPAKGVYHINGLNYRSGDGEPEYSDHPIRFQTIPLIKAYYSAIIQDMIQRSNEDTLNRFVLVLSPIPGNLYNAGIETEIGMWEALYENIERIRGCRGGLQIVLGIPDPDESVPATPIRVRRM